MTFWWLAALFPITCGLIGWITNVVAIRMIFRPYVPVGVGRVRFQGVLAKHQAHFAHQLAGIIRDEFLSAADLVRIVDPKEVLAELDGVVERATERLREAAAEMLEGPQQALLSAPMVAAVRAQLQAELAKDADMLVARLAERADELVDVRELVAERLIAMGPARLEGIIREVSDRELRFIEAYGGVFGAVFGLLQFALVQTVQVRFSLPLIGLVVGIVTNYLAIQMLFYPREPRRVLFGLQWQGLFPRRQREIAAQMGVVASRDLVAPEEVFAQLADRALPARVDPDLLAALEHAGAQRLPGLFALWQGTVPPEQRSRVHDKVAALYPEMRPELTRALARAAARPIDLRALLSQRVAALDKTAFEALLRGLFQREELYLVVYGGLLGAFIGFVQLGLMVQAGW